MSKYKTTGNQTLFDTENAAQKLSEIGNPLEKLDSVIDFEMFRNRLEAAMVNHNTKSNAGAKQYDVVMMFKVMVLCQYYNLSYEQTEYQIMDRSSFKRFLGLASGDKVPDANTIRNFFEGLNEKGLGERLFQDFVDNLLEKGFIFNEGQIVDASFVLATRQRNTCEENKKIKAGEGDGLWNDQPNKKRQKDIDASWTRKGSEDFFGYKVSAKVDGKSKFVKKILVTPASPHDILQLRLRVLERQRVGQPPHHHRHQRHPAVQPPAHRHRRGGARRHPSPSKPRPRPPDGGERQRRPRHPRGVQRQGAESPHTDLRPSRRHTRCLLPRGRQLSAPRHHRRGLLGPQLRGGKVTRITQKKRELFVEKIDLPVKAGLFFFSLFGGVSTTQKGEEGG